MKAVIAGMTTRTIITAPLTGRFVAALVVLAISADARAENVPDTRILTKTFVERVAGKALLDLSDPLCVRIVSDFGAVFVPGRGAQPPDRWLFPGTEAVDQFQAVLSIEEKALATGGAIVLQRPALAAFLNAQTEAEKRNLTITPAGPQAARRSFDETLTLWYSRLRPGLAYWIAAGKITARERDRILALPTRAQVEAVLHWEARRVFFSLRFDKSILYSVAAPGTSQHLSMLALDIREHDNATVRAILARHGWYQTVYSDLPHFTFLGVRESQLRALGLVRWTSGERVFWVPMEKTRSYMPPLDVQDGTCAF